MVRSSKTKKNPDHLVAMVINGFLFIGDPHVWSRKPGRRLDRSYLTTILGKLRWAALEANKRGLQAVCLGDLLHEAGDNDLVMLSSLADALKLFHRRLIVEIGNHDKNETRLAEGTALHHLYTCGLIDVMLENGPYRTFDVACSNGVRKVMLGATPYGERIPVSLAPWGGDGNHDEAKAALGVDDVIWVTHDDLAFDGAYPGATELHPIIGVDVAVNGHMHGYKRPVQRGRTVWHNPGNISRLAVDMIDHVPRVWEWRPEGLENVVSADGLEVLGLTPLIVPHTPGPEIMSLEGRIAVAAKVSNDATDKAEPSSRFVALSLNDSHVGRSDDGVWLSESIAAELAESDPAPAVRDTIERLFRQVLSEGGK